MTTPEVTPCFEDRRSVSLSGDVPDIPPDEQLEPAPQHASTTAPEPPPPPPFRIQDYYSSRPMPPSYEDGTSHPFGSPDFALPPPPPSPVVGPLFRQPRKWQFEVDIPLLYGDGLFGFPDDGIDTTDFAANSDGDYEASVAGIISGYNVPLPGIKLRRGAWTPTETPGKFRSDLVTAGTGLAFGHAEITSEQMDLVIYSEGVTDGMTDIIMDGEATDPQDVYEADFNSDGSNPPYIQLSEEVCLQNRERNYTKRFERHGRNFGLCGTATATTFLGKPFENNFYIGGGLYGEYDFFTYHQKARFFEKGYREAPERNPLPLFSTTVYAQAGGQIHFAMEWDKGEALPEFETGSIFASARALIGLRTVFPVATKKDGERDTEKQGKPER